MDIKAIALGGLKGACGVFLTDLEALPEEAFGERFGGSARTVADIVYEVNLVNDHVGMTIRGEEPFDWPEGGWISAPEGFAGREVVVSAFKESSERILETVDGFSEEDLLGKVTTEHGETDRFERCRFMTLHLWYHSGQLNFIQNLKGDSAWHWG